jgi:hypothetical protein
MRGISTPGDNYHNPADGLSSRCYHLGDLNTAHQLNKRDTTPLYYSSGEGGIMPYILVRHRYAASVAAAPLFKFVPDKFVEPHFSIVRGFESRHI